MKDKAIKILTDNNFTVENDIVSWNDNITIGTAAKVRELLAGIGYKVELKKNVFKLIYEELQEG